MSNVHATAIVEVGAQIDCSASVGPFAVVGGGVILRARARIGSHARLGAEMPEHSIDVGEGAFVGPNALIEGEVRLGEACRVGIGAVVSGPAKLGDRTALFPYCVVGQVGQWPGHHRDDGRVEIGSDVILREFVAVNKAVTAATTRVGDGCYLMARTQVDHDCVLGQRVKTAVGVTLGGSVQVDDDAYLGMNAVVHQGLRVGCGSMIGMNGVVTAHVPPFAVLVERRVTQLNVQALERLGASTGEIAALEREYARLLAGEGECADPWQRAVADFVAAVAPARVAATRNATPSGPRGP